MVSHFLLLVLFAALVSTVFAVIQRDAPLEQLRLGAAMAGAFVGAALLLGWVMYPIPF